MDAAAATICFIAALPWRNANNPETSLSGRSISARRHSIVVSVRTRVPSRSTNSVGFSDILRSGAGGADRAPDAFGGRRHVDMADIAKRVDERVHDRRQVAGAAGLAAALYAQGIGLGWHRMAGAPEHRHIVGARHRVIHVRAGQ